MRWTSAPEQRADEGKPKPIPRIESPPIARRPTPRFRESPVCWRSRFANSHHFFLDRIPDDMIRAYIAMQKDKVIRSIDFR